MPGRRRNTVDKILETIGVLLLTVTFFIFISRGGG